ncbi:hypothetical protein [Mycoplasmopsis sturni]|uniref:hypothetical protein n=1 Tax=Mycoplasmopsis sturni TaxID=39047 RepID=UPI00056D41C5|nr:hypothetical protein [Mycoplasmopsis sturni]
MLINSLLLNEKEIKIQNLEIKQELTKEFLDSTEQLLGSFGPGTQKGDLGFIKELSKKVGQLFNEKIFPLFINFASNLYLDDISLI